jgi:cytochrome c
VLARASARRLLLVAAAAMLYVAGCAAPGPSAMRSDSEVTTRPRSTGGAQPAARLTPAPNVAGNPENGGRLFVSRGCGGCHTLETSAGATGLVGPRLTNVVLRPTLAGEAIQTTPENLARWIMDPPAMKPGTAMPKLGLTEQEAQDIAAFLYSQPYNPIP